MAEDHLLSDELLRELMTIGQVDVLVGIPRSTMLRRSEGFVDAVRQAFARYFSRDHTLQVNSDGGSDDGTPAILRGSSGGATEILTVTHNLRTTHLISTPYHGLPGKGNALRQSGAARPAQHRARSGTSIFSRGLPAR